MSIVISCCLFSAMIEMTRYVDPAFDHVSPKKIFTVDKKEHKNLIARKSCFV